MKVESLAIPGVLLITPPRFADSRGFFSEAYNKARFAAAGLDETFIQDNQSRSRKGVVRGLHCQIGPNTQGKLVRVLRGSIWDVAVDIRRGSPSYGQHVAAVLSAENASQLWVPGGFLHGFMALEDDTDVLYKVNAPYDKAAERGVIWNDPGLALPWPQVVGAIVSDKDMELPHLADCDPWYTL
jgi:dTDP-4-dehydrorhamnose 3,5-epimerase